MSIDTKPSVDAIVLALTRFNELGLVAEVVDAGGNVAIDATALVGGALKVMAMLTNELERNESVDPDELIIAIRDQLDWYLQQRLI